MFTTRAADFNDTTKIRKLIIDSIKSCIKDHHNDQTVIDRWCKNKTEENIRQWITNPQNFSCVVTDDINLLGIALLDKKSAKLLLCYVSPNHQGQGIGTILLKSLEKQCQTMNIDEITLDSTETAHSFYLKQGFVGDSKELNSETGRNSYPMKKILFCHIQKTGKHL